MSLESLYRQPVYQAQLAPLRSQSLILQADNSLQIRSVSQCSALQVYNGFLGADRSEGFDALVVNSGCHVVEKLCMAIGSLVEGLGAYFNEVLFGGRILSHVVPWRWLRSEIDGDQEGDGTGKSSHLAIRA
jgi:hypothetical protein